MLGYFKVYDIINFRNVFTSLVSVVYERRFMFKCICASMLTTILLLGVPVSMYAGVYNTCQIATTELVLVQLGQTVACGDGYCDRYRRFAVKYGCKQSSSRVDCVVDPIAAKYIDRSYECLGGICTYVGSTGVDFKVGTKTVVDGACEPWSPN